MTSIIPTTRSAHHDLTQRRSSRPECPSSFPGGPPFRAGEDMGLILSKAGFKPENCRREPRGKGRR